MICGAAALVALAAAQVASAAFSINVNFTGDARFRPSVDAAVAEWQAVLSGYQSGRVVQRFNSSYSVGQTVQAVFINASVSAIDGPGGTLGQAGPDGFVRDAAGFALSTNGSAQFDSADADNLLASGNGFEKVVMHEIGHILGFGTLWTANGVYVDGSGEFTGANATNFWHSEYGQTGTPDVELGGGNGTRDSHWAENPNIRDVQNRRYSDELMTGFLSGSAYLSPMTVASFVDIGFTSNAVPEPTTLGAVAAAGLLALRRRRV